MRKCFEVLYNLVREGLQCERSAGMFWFSQTREGIG